MRASPPCKLAAAVLAQRDYAHDGFVQLELLLVTHALKDDRLALLGREGAVLEHLLVRLVRLDVVVDALEALEALQELVHLVRIVQMREILPLDVVALSNRRG